MAKTDPRQEILKQIRAMRGRLDPDVLKTTSNYARISLGMPVELNQAAKMLLRATANGGRQREQVLAELELKLGRVKRKH